MGQKQFKYELNLKQTSNLGLFLCHLIVPWILPIVVTTGPLSLEHLTTVSLKDKIFITMPNKPQ